MAIHKLIHSSSVAILSQNERRRADLQNAASDIIPVNFAWGLSYDLSKFSDDFTPFFRL